jgi:hypothetical protein
MSEKKIKVILLEPNRVAKVTEIEHSLEAMQKVVQGDIQAVYPFEEDVCIVCNEEGKLEGLPLNRALYDDDHEIYDIIAGPAFICDCSGESFGSLSEEQIKKYSRQFMRPERFFVTDNGIKAVPFQPYRGYER